MALINGYSIWVSSEKVNYNITTVQHPVETGIDITDHILREPLELSISGKIVGENALDVLSAIRKMQEDGSFVNYEGRNRATNFQIVAFSTSHDYKVTGGCDFDMTLKQVRVANGPTGEITAIKSYKNPGTGGDKEEEEEEEEEEDDEKKEGESKEDGPVNTKEQTLAGMQQKDVLSVAKDVLHYIKKGESIYQIAQKYSSLGAVMDLIADQIPGGAEFLEIAQTVMVATRK